MFALFSARIRASLRDLARIEPIADRRHRVAVRLGRDDLVPAHVERLEREVETHPLGAEEQVLEHALARPLVRQAEHEDEGELALEHDLLDVEEVRAAVSDRLGQLRRDADLIGAGHRDEDAGERRGLGHGLLLGGGLAGRLGGQV